MAVRRREATGAPGSGAMGCSPATAGKGPWDSTWMTATSASGATRTTRFRSPGIVTRNQISFPCFHHPAHGLDLGRVVEIPAFRIEVRQRQAQPQGRARGPGDEQAGAAQVEVQMIREDREVLVKAGWGDKLYLGTELTFTAVGRPSPAV